LITWVAAHSGESVGQLTMDRPSWRWSKAGEPVAIPAGRYELAPEEAGDPGIVLDAWCRSTGFPLAGCWTGESSMLQMTLRETRHALAVFDRAMPECAAWARAVTRVIVPLRDGGATSASGSQPDLPGLVQIAGLNGPVATLEGLVHESAHHHFTMVEAGGVLVDPEHRELYRSPLRDDPRSLRNVFLAVHALHYMVAFYEEALDCGILGPDWATRRDRLRSRFSDGMESLLSGRPHLTSRGECLLRGLIGAS
jgi:HEXXH motif-containing protein